MNPELVQSVLFFIAGAFLIFLAITVARDNLANRLNRITGAMLFFAGIGSVLMALAGLVDPADIASRQLQDTRIYGLHHIWEFFFPFLVWFAWTFPEDRLGRFRFSNLRYLIFVPYLVRILLVLFFQDAVEVFDTLTVESKGGGLLGVVLAPFASILSWVMIAVGYVYDSHNVLYQVVDVAYAGIAIYLLESGKRYLTNPRLLTQTRVVNWAVRIGLGLFVISQIVDLAAGDAVARQISSWLVLASVVVGSGILIFATIRYQFLNVRLIFRQSFVYSITSALLVGFYLMVVVQVRGLLEPAFGEQAETISYAVIILILMFFQPINNWIDELVRGMFVRTRTDHRNVLERFSRQVISLFDPRQLRQIIDETLKTSLLVERVYFVLFDDEVEEYALQPSEDSPKRIVIDRADLMLRGINLLDKPTDYASLSNYRENAALARLLDERQVRVILPMKDAEHLLGFLALTRKAAGYTYSAEDMNLLGVLSNQMVTALTNARLYVESVERMRLQEEVSMARQIQLDLLPSRPPQLVNITIAADSTPSRTVGGDFYDFIKIDQDRVGIVIADASGKGMPAALMIAQTQAVLRSEVKNGNAISKVLANINQHICEASSSEKYVTLFYAELNTRTGLMEYANAGHNYPILIRRDGSIELLKTGGPVIGALPMMKYDCDRVTLATDDVLFLFTDGLSEAMDQAEKEYSEERIVRFITENRSLDPDQLLKSIVEDVNKYDPTDPPRDDRTIIALRVNSNGFAQ